MNWHGDVMLRKPWSVC